MNGDIRNIDKSDISEDLVKISESYTKEVFNYMIEKKGKLDPLNTIGISLQVSINAFRYALSRLSTKEYSLIHDEALLNVLEDFISSKRINKTNGENNELSL